MRPRLWISLAVLPASALAVILASGGCASHSADPQALSAEQRAGVESSVRGFMQTVAHDVTEQGPTVWKKNFADDPAFFMANDGKLVFPDLQAATQGIEAFAQVVPHVELHWGDDLRVDALTPNLAVVAASWKEVQIDTKGHEVDESGFFTAVAELRNGRWQFRDAHWSSIPPPVTPATVPAKTR